MLAEYTIRVLGINHSVRLDLNLLAIGIAADQEYPIVVVIIKSEFLLSPFYIYTPTGYGLVWSFLWRQAQLKQCVLYRCIKGIGGGVGNVQPHLLLVKPVIFFDLQTKLIVVGYEVFNEFMQSRFEYCVDSV